MYGYMMLYWRVYILLQSNLYKLLEIAVGLALTNLHVTNRLKMLGQLWLCINW